MVSGFHFSGVWVLFSCYFRAIFEFQCSAEKPAIFRRVGAQSNLGWKLDLSGCDDFEKANFQPRSEFVSILLKISKLYR